MLLQEVVSSVKLGLLGGLSSVPIHRLNHLDTFGAINVLMRERAKSEKLLLHAGEEGCTVLLWKGDEYLCREVR